jgi:hypothetical protein
MVLSLAVKPFGIMNGAFSIMLRDYIRRPAHITATPKTSVIMLVVRGLLVNEMYFVVLGR